MAESSRLPLIGVIGGDDSTGCARLVGRELTQRGCVVLTGGQALDGRRSTKNAALMGTIDAERQDGSVARYIGVLPNALHGTFGFESLSKTQLLIHTDLDSMGGDPINGVTPDVLICFGGGQGTLCELAFGVAVGRSAVFHGHAAQLLLDKCTERRNIERIANQWGSHLHIKHQKGRTTVDVLIDYLRQAVSRPVLWTASEIVQSALHSLPPVLKEVPEFPGLPGSDYQKQIQQFASYWKTLSSS